MIFFRWGILLMFFVVTYLCAYNSGTNRGYEKALQFDPQCKPVTCPTTSSCAFTK